MWFVRALILQFFALALLLPPPLVGTAIIAVASLASPMIRSWTFRRGLARSSRAWKITTDIFVLLSQG